MTSSPTALAFLQGGHEMGARIRAFDWASHPLGPPEGWPAALQMALSLCLNSSFPTAIYWGPSMYTLYNDAWSVIPAERHPVALGQPAKELWSDIWATVGPEMESVLATGEGLAQFEQMLPMVRAGLPRESWWNYSFTALRNPDNTIGGIFNQGNEVTALVLARRAREAELDRLRELFRQAPQPIALLRGPDHVFDIANEAYRRLVGGRDVEGKAVSQALPEVVKQGFIPLLDKVYQSGEPYVATGMLVKLEQALGAPAEDRLLDFIYQPVRDASGRVDGILVLITDVTDRARAEAALRTTNWQLGEERARLAAMVEAEKRAQAALRRFNDTLEAHVRLRTAELERTMAQQGAIADRLRATFETSLIYQGFIGTDGVLLDANTQSLSGIQAKLSDVVGRPFWETRWFESTPGLAERIREGVAAALSGMAVREVLDVNLPIGPRRFDFSLRPVFNGRGEIVGVVPEAVDITGRDVPASP
ncbi:PAS domain-containing protein [Caenimonas aquaedulcis]|uniref:PAS domain-containing protein n=1 Tax=Caenimonas aquaedulcis TaxID=2793270 RepID=A0A931H1K9_9BURK|nr:PAS domain-containing protein [Caenimonas aquaedulcis]MBG9386860.1 PAS domain-containing protein [Caenimonas aquaedulcis]